MLKMQIRWECYNFETYSRIDFLWFLLWGVAISMFFYYLQQADNDEWHLHFDWEVDDFLISHYNKFKDIRNIWNRTFDCEGQHFL